MKKPGHLYKEAGPMYEKLYSLVENGIRDGDENLLAVLANAYWDYRKASEVLSGRGPVLAGETMVRKNPAFDIVKDTVKIIESLSGHFGFSPKARNEKMDLKGEEKDKLDALMDG